VAARGVVREFRERRQYLLALDAGRRALHSGLQDLQVYFSRQVLYCTVLYCTVLYCTVLYCTVLYVLFYHSHVACTRFRAPV